MLWNYLQTIFILISVLFSRFGTPKSAPEVKLAQTIIFLLLLFFLFPHSNFQRRLWSRCLRS